MLDLDNISVSKECVMMCREVQYENEDGSVWGPRDTLKNMKKLHIAN